MRCYRYQNIKRIRIKCFLAKNEEIESVTSVFKSANWSEREMFDMFGVKIVNHPNMKRILMQNSYAQMIGMTTH